MKGLDLRSPDCDRIGGSHDPAPPFEVAAKKICKVRTRESPQQSPTERVARITGRVGNSTTLETAAALKPLLVRLPILHYGDSHGADPWTGELRRFFQAKFGRGGARFCGRGSKRLSRTGSRGGPVNESTGWPA